MRRVLQWGLFALYSVFVAVLFLGVLEAGLAWLYHHPNVLSSVGPKDALKRVYNTRRSVIQVKRECARWDPIQKYTLRPGVCSHTNIEYDSTYRINSVGLRDDESSLDAPEIIVVGDSHTMGWGVEQEETFAQRLERATGLVVLNTGISSYATAHEMTLLRRLDLSRLKLLVVQYTQNDFLENRAFLNRSRRSGSWPRWRFRRENAIEELRVNAGYEIGMYFRGLIPGELPPLGETKPERDAKEAQVFLDVLFGTKVLRPEVPILVLEINGGAKLDSGFIDAARSQLAQMNSNRRIEFLSLEGLLDLDHFYVLDDHMRATGHEIVAREIEARIAGLIGEPPA